MTVRLVFEFDGASPRTLEVFEQLPERLAGRSWCVDHRPVAPPDGHPVTPWMRLLAGPSPGRWACEQVLRRWQAEPAAQLAALLRREAGDLPPASGDVPAVLWDGRRFAGPHLLDALSAALPPA